MANREWPWQTAVSEIFHELIFLKKISDKGIFKSLINIVLKSAPENAQLVTKYYAISS